MKLEDRIKMLEQVRAAAKSLAGDFILYDIDSILQSQAPYSELFDEVHDDLRQLLAVIAASEADDPPQRRA